MRGALLCATTLAGIAVALAAPRGRVPRVLKIGYGGFVGLLIPVYWRHYGPANFLWLSDLGLFGTTAAVLSERPEIAGTAAGVLPLELAWSLDYVSGGRLLGLADYMFDSSYPRGLRALSLFHLALPPTLIWLLARLGYDRRSLARQTLALACALVLTRGLTDPEKDINRVLSLGTGRLLVALPMMVLLPLDHFLRRSFEPPR